MRYLLDSVWVALGAAIGANARYWLGYVLSSRGFPDFPWPTLLVNVTGSLALGAFLALTVTHGWGHGSRLFVAVGICGGFTTFSAFSAEMVRLIEERQIAPAMGYFLASNLLSISACLAGAHFARLLWRGTT